MDANGIVKEGAIVEIQIDGENPLKILIASRNPSRTPLPPPGVQVVSPEAPVPKKILGATAGDEVLVITPGGERCVKIVSVCHADG